MKSIKTFSLAIIILASSCQVVESKKEEQVNPWISLSDPASEQQWKVVNGAATYSFDKGVITGVTKWDTPNTFLATKARYSDFILELEVKVDSTINSGIQFRSNRLSTYRNGVVHGYQCEIDPSPRAWSGGIYDEQRRGWLYDLDQNPEGKAAFKNGEWNAYRIEAIGPNLRTWVNGINTANLIDSLTSEGFIALQVHSISDSAKAGKTIQWRNINILTEQLSAATWEPHLTAPEIVYSSK